MSPLFPDFRKIRKRMKRSLNYGTKEPTKLNFPLSELVVEFFDQKCTFDYMEPETSTSISKRGFADPCTLVVALVYLDRLRNQNKQFFESTDPASLYIPALVLASKYLHDADTYDRVSNSEWAESLDMKSEDINSMEWNFIEKLDWNATMKNEEFENCLNSMEKWVASSFMKKNGFATYNELSQLSSTIPMLDILFQLFEYFSGFSIFYCLTFVLMTSTVQQPIIQPAVVSDQISGLNRSYPMSWMLQDNIDVEDKNESYHDSAPNTNLNPIPITSQGHKLNFNHLTSTFTIEPQRYENDDYYDFPDSLENFPFPLVASCPILDLHAPNIHKLLSF